LCFTVAWLPSSGGDEAYLLVPRIKARVRAHSAMSRVMVRVRAHSAMSRVMVRVMVRVAWDE